jgi:hypothetical protein
MRLTGSRANASPILAATAGSVVDYADALCPAGCRLMIRVCPNPIPWSRVHKRLVEHFERTQCGLPPPIPLILAGWTYSNDAEKLQRWKQTIEWAESNGCTEILTEIPEQEFYMVDKLTTHRVGPLGGPMYLPWDYTPKERPSPAALYDYLERLRDSWPIIVGEILSRITRPLAFTGSKARRLVVEANGDVFPPWGSWTTLSQLESERRTFTRFRAAINAQIEPHHVDHVGFYMTKPSNLI